MTVTRLGQLTAETQFLGDFITDGSNAPDISSTKANTGIYSYRFSNNNAADPIGLGFSPVAKLRAGVWVNHNGAQGSTSQVILFRLRKGSGDANPHSVRWDEQNDELELRIDNVDVATVSALSTLLPTVDTWMHLGIVFYAHASEGFFSFYLNGAQILTYSGNTNADPIGAVLFGGRYTAGDSWANFAYFDDFYVDSLTDESDLPPTSKRFLWGIVDANGSLNQWTPEGAVSNYECVDDPGAPDEDATYVKTLQAGDVDRYEHSGVSVPGTYRIRAVIPTAIAKKTDAGTDAELGIGLYDGVNTETDDDNFVPTAYDTIWGRFESQPDGTTWNETDLNAMQLVIESQGTF